MYIYIVQTSYGDPGLTSKTNSYINSIWDRMNLMCSYLRNSLYKHKLRRTSDHPSTTKLVLSSMSTQFTAVGNLVRAPG